MHFTVQRPLYAQTRVTVPKLWTDATVVCIATGPSLAREDVDYVRGRAKVIAISDAYLWAPWADVLHASDEKWWGWHKGAPSFTGPKFACAGVKQPRTTRWPDVQVIQSTGRHGLELSPDGIRDGHNSGYQAIGIAKHLGASRIILLGYDMSHGGRHFFGLHPDRSGPIVDFCLRAFATLPPALKAAGITVINCTRETNLKVFPQMTLKEALP